MTIVNNYRYNHEDPTHFETPSGDSMTVPNMTMSPSEILERFTRGQQVATFTPVYRGEDEYPNIEAMDPMERLDYARSIKEQLEDAKNRPAPAEPLDPIPTATAQPDPPVKEEKEET